MAEIAVRARNAGAVAHRSPRESSAFWTSAISATDRRFSSSSTSMGSACGRHWRPGRSRRPVRAGILRQLGAALGAAHAAGVAHQDLKPENIMLQRSSDGSETLKLIDFGIAKVDRSEIEAGMTTVSVAGTIRYMAPEQFHGENSPACDVYALALVTCEMLSGQADVRALPPDVGTRTRRLVNRRWPFVQRIDPPTSGIGARPWPTRSFNALVFGAGSSCAWPRRRWSSGHRHGRGSRVAVALHPAGSGRGKGRGIRSSPRGLPGAQRSDGDGGAESRAGRIRGLASLRIWRRRLLLHKAHERPEAAGDGSRVDADGRDASRGGL